MKITPEAQTKICEVLADGGTIKMAAQLVGCTERAIYQAGNRDLEFRHRICAARSESEHSSLRTLNAAAKSKKHWRAAYLRLRVLYPEKYARAPKTMSVAEVREFIERVVVQISSHLRAGTRAKILRRVNKLISELPPKKKRRYHSQFSNAEQRPGGSP